MLSIDLTVHLQEGEGKEETDKGLLLKEPSFPQLKSSHFSLFIWDFPPPVSYLTLLGSPRCSLVVYYSCLFVPLLLATTGIHKLTMKSLNKM